MIRFETISEQTCFPELYKETLWGSKTWPEVEAYWKDALDVIDGRDAFAKTWNLESVQKLAWDGNFTMVKHIEVYRPYKPYGIPEYIVCVSLKQDQCKKTGSLLALGFVPWDMAFYDTKHQTFCSVQVSEEAAYSIIQALDKRLKEEFV